MNEMMRNVLDTSMMTAAEMTHALCELGNGSMGDGIRTVFENGVQKGIQLGILGGFPVGWERGWKSGHTNGLLTGTAGIAGGVALAGLCIYGYKKYKAKKAKSAEEPLNISRGSECNAN